MESIMIDIKSKSDTKLFINLANRLGLKSRVLTDEEKEDIGLGIAIEEGRKSGYVDEKTIKKTISKLLKK